MPTPLEYSLPIFCSWFLNNSRKWENDDVDLDNHTLTPSRFYFSDVDELFEQIFMQIIRECKFLYNWFLNNSRKWENDDFSIRYPCNVVANMHNK